MKVRVDPDKCQGHTLCWLAAPEAFELDELDGHATALLGDVPLGDQEQVAEAVLSCPEQAIEVTP